MESRIFCPLLIVLMTFCVSITGDSTSSLFETKNDFRVKDEFTYTAVHSINEMQCALQCKRNETCLSAAFHDQGTSCELSSHRSHGVDYQDRLISGSGWKALSKRCLDGWTMVGCACYIFSTELKTFNQSVEFCSEAGTGGKLAEPRTNETYQVLVNYLVTSGHERNYWFGLVDLFVEGTFVWHSDGVEPDYAPWITDNPENWMNSDCTIMGWSNNFRWGDDPCDRWYHPMCEMKL